MMNYLLFYIYLVYAKGGGNTRGCIFVAIEKLPWGSLEKVVIIRRKISQLMN